MCHAGAITRNVTVPIGSSQSFRADQLRETTMPATQCRCRCRPPNLSHQEDACASVQFPRPNAAGCDRRGSSARPPRPSPTGGSPVAGGPFMAVATGQFTTAVISTMHKIQACRAQCRPPEQATAESKLSVLPQPLSPMRR